MNFRFCPCSWLERAFASLSYEHATTCAGSCLWWHFRCRFGFPEGTCLKLNMEPLVPLADERFRSKSCCRRVSTVWSWPKWKASAKRQRSQWDGHRGSKMATTKPSTNIHHYLVYVCKGRRKACTSKSLGRTLEISGNACQTSTGSEIVIPDFST